MIFDTVPVCICWTFPIPTVLYWTSPTSSHHVWDL